MYPAAAGIRDLNAAAGVADNTWEESAFADNARGELGVADFVEDNPVPRTGTELAGYDQVVVIISGEGGRIGAHAAEVNAQAVEYVVL